MNWIAFGAIAQACAAVATFAAVIVALWQTKYANRKKLKLSFSENSQIISNNGIEVLPSLTVTNIGNRTITIQNWGFIVNRQTKGVVIQDSSDMMLLGIDTPLPHKLEPEESITLAMQAEKLYRSFKTFIEKGTCKPNRYITVFVTDSTQKVYKIWSSRTAKELVDFYANNGH